MQKKHVRVQCHGPIAFGPQYKSPWEDVWLSWKGKPGRTVYRAAPCLICRAEIVENLKSHEEIREEEDDSRFAIPGIEHTPTPKAERATWYRAEDAVMEKALRELEAQPYAVLNYGRKDHIEEVATSAKGIDRAEAERMMAFYLERVFGVRNVKFDWDRRPEFGVTPVGFGDYS